MEDSAEPAPRIISLLGNLPSRNATNFQSLGASETQQSMLIKVGDPLPAIPGRGRCLTGHLG